MAEDRAAHDGEVGIGADEVMREEVHEVQQAAKRRAVHMHRSMLCAHGDAVLLEVCVRAVLEAPLLATQLDGDDAEVLTSRMATGQSGRPARVSLVLNAQLAGRIRLPRRCGARGRDIAWVLLRLGFVDGDLQRTPRGVRHPLKVARDGGATYVVDVAAELVEPISSCLWSLRESERPKARRNL